MTDTIMGKVVALCAPMLKAIHAAMPQVVVSCMVKLPSGKYMVLSAEHPSTLREGLDDLVDAIAEDNYTINGQTPEGLN